MLALIHKYDKKILQLRKVHTIEKKYAKYYIAEIILYCQHQISRLAFFFKNTFTNFYTSTAS